MPEVDHSSLLERHQRLIEISRQLAATHDLNTLLNRIVQAAADLCHAEAASILLYDEINHQLFFEAATNLEAPMMQGLIVPVDTSIAGWVITRRQPVMLEDAQHDPRHFGELGSLTGIQTTTLLAVPMIAKGQAMGVLETINKITGQFTLEDQDVLVVLAAQAAVAIENARLAQQADLIAELVHEVSTPLGSLNAVAYLLLRPEINTEQRQKYVQTILMETTRLAELTSAFLDLARLESGRGRFRIESVELKQLLEECAEVMRGKAAEKEQELNVRIDPNIPTLNADRGKLKQVVINLLSNAIKYTPPHGQITLKGIGKPGEATLHVIDTGSGIPAADLPHIFEKFYRVPGSNQAARGVGLGLSICRRIVEAHGGKIEVSSQLGSGTHFTVRLPLLTQRRLQ